MYSLKTQFTYSEVKQLAKLKIHLKMLNNSHHVQIDWLRYFQLVHKEGFLPEEELLNFSPHYFGRMASFIHETPKRYH